MARLPRNTRGKRKPKDTTEVRIEDNNQQASPTGCSLVHTPLQAGRGMVNVGFASAFPPRLLAQAKQRCKEIDPLIESHQV